MSSDSPLNGGIRRYPRLHVDVSVRVTSSKEKRVTFARGHDISCGGMALYVPLEFVEGDNVKLNFELPNSRVQFGISAVIKNRNGFRYGVEFIELTPEESKEIERVAGILALVPNDNP